MNKETQPLTAPLPQLVKGSSTYKLVVPASVEEKIRYLIHKFPHTEWSGILFFTYEGSFADDNLTVTCRDIFPMDLGSSGWTEFRMSEDVAAYMAEHIELFDCQTGLIHSHHSMGAFFSSQDNLMLQQEGNDTNCFVSLVVDTKGTYVARITRKVQTNTEVTIRSLGSSYEFFGEGTKQMSPDSSATSKVVSKDIIEYFDLSVERHVVDNKLSYLDARFDEIDRKKQNSFDKSLPVSVHYDSAKDRGFFESLHQERALASEPALFGQPLAKYPAADAKDSSVGLSSWTPDPKLIHAAVVHIVTCNLILNPERVNLAQWVRQHMKNVYKRIFREPDFIYTDSKIDAFCEWKDFIIQFTLDYFDYSTAPDSVMDDICVAQGIVAKAISNELSTSLDRNPYIDEYITALSMYVI